MMLEAIKERVDTAYWAVRLILWTALLWLAFTVRTFALLIRRTLGCGVCLVRGHQDVDMAVRGTRARVRWCPTCFRTEWID